MTRRRADLTFWGGAVVAGLLLLAAERAVLAATFRTVEPAGEIAATFVRGMRFDAAGLAYVLGLAFLVCTLIGLRRRTDGGALRGATAALGFAALVAAVEVPFFREFRVRLDFVALEYMDEPGTAIGLGFASVGVLGSAAVVGSAAAATAACAFALRRLRAATLARAPGRPDAVATAVIAAALVVLARGGFGRPIRPQDADRSPHPLVNQLDLSGPMTLERQLWQWVAEDPSRRVDYGVPLAEADAAVAEEPADAQHVVAEHPRVFTVHETGKRSLVGANVVLVVMESFAAKHVGVCGAKGADAWTPSFDALFQKRCGFLFTNCWSAGPCTDRALPALLTSFPSLPSRIFVTKSAVGEQDFRGLPRILGELKYDTCFVTGGASGWENLGSWLRRQGFASVVGRDDFPEPWRSSAWGASDEAILDRVLAECDARAGKGPFFVATLTSTNHPPFAVPDDDLGRSVSGATDRERAMRYADAAIGRFADAALARPWAKDTIFLFVADHGFHEDPQAAIDPDRYRIPMILLEPEGRSVNPVRTYPTTAFCEWLLPASQLDVLPLVLRLVAPEGTRYATWGAVPKWFKPEDERTVVLGPDGGQPFAAALDQQGRFLVERFDGGPSRLWHLVGGDVREMLVPPDGSGDAAVREREKEPPWPNGRLVPLDDPEAKARLSRYLRAYLTSAQNVLLARNASGAR